MPIKNFGVVIGADFNAPFGRYNQGPTAPLVYSLVAKGVEDAVSTGVKVGEVIGDFAYQVERAMTDLTYDFVSFTTHMPMGSSFHEVIDSHPHLRGVVTTLLDTLKGGGSLYNQGREATVEGVREIFTKNLTNFVIDHGNFGDKDFLSLFDSSQRLYESAYESAVKFAHEYAGQDSEYQSLQNDVYWSAYNAFHPLVVEAVTEINNNQGFPLVYDIHGVPVVYS